MEELNEINPTLKQTLYTKYFEEKLDHVILTQQEKDYIKKAKTFHVMIMSNQAPLFNMLKVIRQRERRLIY